jgi:hypothetical protein
VIVKQNLPHGRQSVRIRYFVPLNEGFRKTAFDIMPRDSYSS